MTPPISKVPGTAYKLVEQPRDEVNEVSLGKFNGQDIVLFDVNGNGVYDKNDSIEIIFKRNSNGKFIDTQSTEFKINHLRSSLRKWGFNSNNWQYGNDEIRVNFKDLKLKHFGIFKGMKAESLKSFFETLKLMEGKPVRILFVSYNSDDVSVLGQAKIKSTPRRAGTPNRKTIMYSLVIKKPQ